MLTTEIKNNIKKHLTKSSLHENIISELELNNLRKVVFSGWTDSRTYPGGKIIFNNFNDKTQHYLKDFLISYFPDSLPDTSLSWDDVKIFGNIYITPSEYGIHTDAFTKHVIDNSEVNLKNVIIPLYVCGNDIDHPYINNLILMQNRLIDYDKTFQKNSTKQWHVKYQDNITDYSALEWVDENGNYMNLDPDKMYISNDEYQKYLSHIKNKEILESFKIEQAAKFKTGNIIVHDTTQVHVTGQMRYGDAFVSNKAGVRLFLRVPLSSIA